MTGASLGLILAGLFGVGRAGNHPMHFPSMDGHVGRRLDAKPHFISSNFDDCDNDVAVDHDLLVALSR